ncbi:hypothetical protein Btru_028152 [Bulinus truncatus]|nr:hypothetical protein Btru_028152 [Bulinus truncatus]
MSPPTTTCCLSFRHLLESTPVPDEGAGVAGILLVLRQIQQLAGVGPGTELQVAALVVEREPCYVDGARALEHPGRHPQALPGVRDDHVGRVGVVKVVAGTVDRTADQSISRMGSQNCTPRDTKSSPHLLYIRMSGTQTILFGTRMLDTLPKSSLFHFSADEPCRLYCEVLGENVTEVNLVKISQDGTRTDVVGDDGYDSVYQSFNNGVRRLKSAVVTGDIDFYTGVKFECSADNIYGDHVTRDISVFIPPKLVKEHSEITVVRAQDNSDAVMLNLTCTVKAQTRGSVTFSWGGDNILSNHWEEVPDVITALPGNEYMATKLVAFDPADESTKLKYASCSAGGSLTSYGDSLSLEIPDTEILSA